MNAAWLLGQEELQDDSRSHYVINACPQANIQEANIAVIESFCVSIRTSPK